VIIQSLRAVRKVGRREALTINPEIAARIRAYLDFAGHGADHDGPMFRPLRGNAAPHDPAGKIVPRLRTHSGHPWPN
jgi:hypothetical protein